MTRKQQQTEFNLRKEKFERKTLGEDVIIYDNKVILRQEHPNYKPQSHDSKDHKNKDD